MEKKKTKSNVKQFSKSRMIHFFLIYSLGSIKKCAHSKFTFNKIFNVDLVNFCLLREFLDY